MYYTNLNYGSKWLLTLAPVLYERMFANVKINFTKRKDFSWFGHLWMISSQSSDSALDHLNQELPTMKDRADFTIEIDYFV
jgi:hypothetical protein